MNILLAGNKLLIHYTLKESFLHSLVVLFWLRPNTAFILPSKYRAKDKSRVDHPGSVLALTFPCQCALQCLQQSCALLWSLPQQTHALVGLVQSRPDVLLLFPLLLAERLTCWHSPEKEPARDSPCCKWARLPFPPPWALASELREQRWYLLLHIKGMVRVRSLFPHFSLQEIVWR